MVGILARRVVPCRGRRGRAGRRALRIRNSVRIDLFVPERHLTVSRTDGPRAETVIAFYTIPDARTGRRATGVSPPCPVESGGASPRVYLLPSLFTMGNMFCGYACVVYAMRGEYETAAPFIGFAFVLDMLDGRIARLTGGESEFGLQFDSLADVISFGIAPAILSFAWGLAPLGRLGWAAAFLFLACAAMRLARQHPGDAGGQTLLRRDAEPRQPRRCRPRRFTRFDPARHRAPSALLCC